MKNLIKSWQSSSFIIHEFEELQSTNSLAIELANNRQIGNFEIILAHAQSHGKGRLNRSWQSPIGNLYFSLLLTNPNLPQFCAKNIPQISFLTIAALGLAINNLYENLINSADLKISFKWPNDLIINDKKVAGVLLESKISQEKCDFVVVGVGINTRSAPKNFDQEISSKALFAAASLDDFLNKNDKNSKESNFSEPRNQQILSEFLSEFQKLYENWLNFGFSAARNIWLAHAFRLKQEISLNLENENLTGIFEDLDENGNLLLKTDSTIKKITCGDVGVGN